MKYNAANTLGGMIWVGARGTSGQGRRVPQRYRSRGPSCQGATSHQKSFTLFLSSLAETISISLTALAWPIVPLGLWIFGRRLGNKVEYRQDRIVTRLVAAMLRIVGSAMFFSPTAIGNEVFALPVPSMWVILWRFTDAISVRKDPGGIQLAYVSLTCFLLLALFLQIVGNLWRMKIERSN
jgi:hypothetical protein